MVMAVVLIFPFNWPIDSSPCEQACRKVHEVSPIDKNSDWSTVFDVEHGKRWGCHFFEMLCLRWLGLRVFGFALNLILLGSMATHFDHYVHHGTPTNMPRELLLDVANSTKSFDSAGEQNDSVLPSPPPPPHYRRLLAATKSPAQKNTGGKSENFESSQQR